VTVPKQTEKDQREDAEQDEDGDEGEKPKPPVTGPLSTPGQGATFTAEQQEYLNKLIAEERRTALRKFKDSDEFKTLTTRARRADEIEGQSRQSEEELSEALAKAKAERAQALAQAENALIRAQITAIAGQRGIPGERIQDAILLMDKSGIKANLADGTVTGAEEAVQALVESRPYLVGPGVAPRETQRERPAPNLNSGARGAPATEEARIAQAMEEMRAHGMGRI
jgi:hypothetical protein